MKVFFVLLVMLSIDFMLILGSFAVVNVNPEGNNFIGHMSYNQTMISKHDSGGYTFNESYVDYLPVDEGGVTGTGNIFTDTFRTARGWISSGKSALRVIGILMFGPAVYLHAIGVPSVVTFGVGVIWFLTTIVILVSWILGRNV